MSRYDYIGPPIWSEMEDNMFKPIQYKQHNNFDRKENSDNATIADYGKSLTVQSFAEDADINVIMERYGVTGQMPLNPKTPMYGDFSNINDYQSSMNAIINAQRDFMDLPAKIRARFDNNPQRLLEFMEDKQNLEEAIGLGLCKRPEPDETKPTGEPAKTTETAKAT
jgi:phage internal scaffolding protein